MAYGNVGCEGRIAYVVSALAVIGLGATLVTPCFGASGDDRSELLGAAKKLAHEYDAFYAAKDPIAMSSLYADDGILVSPSGKIIRGRKDLLDYYKARFASGARHHAIGVDDVHVFGAGGYSLSHFSVVVPTKTGALAEEHGTIVAIYQHDAEGWHMTLVQPSVQGHGS